VTSVLTQTEAEPGSSPRVVSGTGSLRGSLRLPSDKSVAHRALLFDAMGSGEATVTLFRPGEDVRSTAAALRTLGAADAAETASDGTTRVHVRGGGSADGAQLRGAGDETLDCGNAGTGMRLFAGALAGRATTARLVGDASLSSRPMERIAGPLRAMGATIETTDGHAPLAISGRRPLAAMAHVLPVASAQVLGSIVLAGLAGDGTTTVSVPGPTRDHTERMLGWLGAPVRREGLTTIVDGPASVTARDMTAPGDISAAAAWLVAGALHPDASIRLAGVGLNPSRTAIIDVLREMGADIEIAPDPEDLAGPEPTGTITVRGGRDLHAIDITGDRVADLIDELPLLGVAMAGASGTSELRDAAELRLKESDRIDLVVSNLAACGADIEELPDGWRIRRGSPHAADIRTAGDHRIAMAFAVASLTGVAGEVRIDDPDCASVSYPGFWTDLEVLSA
jgi:3-phosphoshikimate 1-carboxyvinyltransferase